MRNLCISLLISWFNKLYFIFTAKSMFNYSPMPLIIDSVNEKLALCPDILKEQHRTIILEYPSVQEMSNISDADKIHKILESINSLNTLDIDFIIVSENILTDDDYMGITLIPHIRYANAINEIINKLPIIILTEDAIDADFYKNRFKYANFLLSDGVEIITVGNNPQATSDNILEAATKLIRKVASEDIRKLFIEGIFLQEPPTTTRHSIANEWGAWSLARTAGMPDLPTLSNDLYFKYLVEKYQPQRTQSNETLNNVEKKLNILLIDDQANKGWEKVLHWIFKHKILKNTTYECTITSILSTEEVKDAVINEDWDLIFLDLRIPTEDAGKALLTKIKELRPDHQVIIFTASNKAWNHKELYNLGADGYFIKEHPEQANSDYSKGNYKNLLDTIKSCLDNGEKLKRFWQHIAKISPIIGNPTVNIIAEDGFPNAADKIATRLKQRLRMFYGLLKRAHQQTEFDETNFYYSDIELAFMTLWSCFNEIQQNYYTKTGWNENNTRARMWVLKDKPDSIFINIGHCIEFDKSFSEKYRVTTDFNRGGDRDIGAQIAFIILEHPRLTNRGNSLLCNLYELKEKRNKLYLIHGDDTPSNTFYQDEIKDSLQITETEFKDLFKIVYFVLTGTIVTYIN